MLLVSLGIGLFDFKIILAASSVNKCSSHKEIPLSRNISFYWNYITSHYIIYWTRNQNAFLSLMRKVNAVFTVSILIKNTNCSAHLSYGVLSYGVFCYVFEKTKTPLIYVIPIKNLLIMTMSLQELTLVNVCFFLSIFLYYVIFFK